MEAIGEQERRANETVVKSLDAEKKLLWYEHQLWEFLLSYYDKNIFKLYLHNCYILFKKSPLHSDGYCAVKHVCVWARMCERERQGKEQKRQRQIVKTIWCA